MKKKHDAHVRGQEKKSCAKKSQTDIIEDTLCLYACGMRRRNRQFVPDKSSFPEVPKIQASCCILLTMKPSLITRGEKVHQSAHRRSLNFGNFQNKAHPSIQNINTAAELLRELRRKMITMTTNYGLISKFAKPKIPLILALFSLSLKIL